MTKKQDNKQNVFKWVILTWGIVVVLPFFIFFTTMWAAKTGSLGFDPLPSLEELENPKSNQASVIYTQDKVMEAHPCEKESFLDSLWRYANEIVSYKPSSKTCTFICINNILLSTFLL
mgnify:CR=1 FL=1